MEGKKLICNEPAGKLFYLPAEVAEKEYRSYVIVDAKLGARSFGGLGPANVFFEHSFELSSNESMYHREREMAFEHNKMFSEELDVMLKARIVRPGTSTW